MRISLALTVQTVLPSTIVNLHLTEFYPHPNPYRPVPTAATLPTIPSGKVLGPLVSRGMPRLSSICLRVLLSSRSSSSNLPPLLSMYSWDGPHYGRTHPLLEPDALHAHLPQISPVDCALILQTLRSSAAEANKRPGASFRDNPLPQQSHKAPPSDDASTNPYFYPCPSPRHLEYSGSFSAGQTTRQIFLHPAEERIEWRAVLDHASLPIQWYGCSPGCLDFLEHNDDQPHAADDQWGLDDDDDDIYNLP